MSPIIGLSDRGLSFPEIGQIRKGAKKTENRPGADLTYFRVEFDEREKKAAETFNEIYKGGKPANIRIILPFNEIDRVWEAWLEAYTAGRMVARSDGEKYIYLVDTKTGDAIVQNGEPYTKYDPKIPAGYDYQNKPVFCKPSGRLKVIIPELARAAYMTVLTTSIHDIAEISAQLEAFSRLNKGRIAGIPFILRRRPKKISRPDSKDKTKRVRVEKWLLSIEADPEWVKAMLIEMKSLALPGNGIKLLPETSEPLEALPIEPPAGFTNYEEDEDEEEAIEGEFTEPEPTPEPVTEQPPAPPKTPEVTNGNQTPLDYKTIIIRSGHAQNETQAKFWVQFMNPLPKTEEAVIAWAKAMRGWLDSDKKPAEAAKLANEGKYPK
jgi:hypothetical protein